MSDSICICAFAVYACHFNKQLFCMRLWTLCKQQEYKIKILSHWYHKNLQGMHKGNVLILRNIINSGSGRRYGVFCVLSEKAQGLVLRKIYKFRQFKNFCHLPSLLKTVSNLAKVKRWTSNIFKCLRTLYFRERGQYVGKALRNIRSLSFNKYLRYAIECFFFYNNYFVLINNEGSHNIYLFFFLVFFY